MAHEIERIEPVVQDIDLFGRLTDYFEHLDQNLPNGLGWLIFNASGARGRRISTFLLDRFHRSEVPFTFQHVPWRDFALNAYMVQVELQSIEQSGEELDEHARDEFDIATRISRDILVRMVAADVLLLSGVAPKHRHEVDLLGQTIERRHNLMAPTLFLTPAQPHQLAIDMASIAPDENIWDRIFNCLYRRCLVAV